LIALIVAMDSNRVIGKDNQLPWHLPADLAYFKKVTLGHKIVMGRKTFESIGRPLPDRENMILTRDPLYNKKGVQTLHSIDELLILANEVNETIFVIGGAEIFNEMLEYATKLYITKIHHEYEGDTYFPVINPREWKVCSSKLRLKDDKNVHDLEFVVYDKI